MNNITCTANKYRMSLLKFGFTKVHFLESRNNRDAQITVELLDRIVKDFTFWYGYLGCSFRNSPILDDEVFEGMETFGHEPS